MKADGFPIARGAGAYVRARRGFTLVEVVIAVGLTAATVLTVFALLIPARDGSREAALTASAVRLQPALERYLQNRGMAEVMEAVPGEDGAALFAVYEVRVKKGTGGTPEESDLYFSAQGTLADDFSLVTVVRDLSDPADVAAVENEIDALEGPTFVVRLGFDIGDEVQPDDPAGGLSGFRKAVLVLSADFVEVPSGRAAGDWGATAERKRPVLTVPVSVRR